MLRRGLLLAGLGLALPPRRRAGAADAPSRHAGPGLMAPPVPMPRMAATLDDGQATDLDRLARGRITALQFVLTGCGSICPVLGTIFARVQRDIADPVFQLVSLSLDPAHDTPAAFTAWLRQFGAGPAWRAAIPRTDQDGIADLLRGWNLSSGTSSAFHTDSVLLIDRQARAVFRFPDLPDPAKITDMMHRLAQVQAG